MAKEEVTGATSAEVSALRDDFEASPKADLYDFDSFYCLFQIPYQPEDYEGRDRFCQQAATCLETDRCRFHKSRSKATGHTETLEDPALANLKHSAYASMDTIKKTLEPHEQKLYDEVLSWAETYHIDREADPAVWDDLVILAGERVRHLRTQTWMFQHGESQEQPIFDPDGNIVDHETLPSGLSEEHRRITQMVMGLKRELGLTRKERLKQDTLDTATDSANALAEAMGAMIQDKDTGYSPEDYEFEPEDSEKAGEDDSQ